MPILENEKHERFAQGLARGLPIPKAYTDAGYRPSRSNASNMAGMPHIDDRVKELKKEIKAGLNALILAPDTEDEVFDSLASMGINRAWIASAFRTIYDSSVLMGNAAGATGAINALLKMVEHEEQQGAATADQPEEKVSISAVTDMLREFRLARAEIAAEPDPVMVTINPGDDT